MKCKKSELLTFKSDAEYISPFSTPFVKKVHLKIFIALVECKANAWSHYRLLCDIINLLSRF